MWAGIVGPFSNRFRISVLSLEVVALLAPFFTFLLRKFQSTLQGLCLRLLLALVFRVCPFCKDTLGDVELGSIVRIFVSHLRTFIERSEEIPWNLHHPIYFIFVI